MPRLLLSWLGFALVTLASCSVQKRDALPVFALTYAPHTFLHSGESYWPSDVATHLKHVQPEVNFKSLAPVGSVTLDTLNTYNSSVYLTAEGDPSSNPSWTTSGYGKPDNSTGLSGAPATIIATEVNATTTDVFYFYFFSYNYGGKVLEINFDDHVGDWEHVMIRFIDGNPYAIYFSQHGAGSAYYWSVPNFVGKRPITFIARGTHANYVKSGEEDYTFAGGIVSDHTDSGYFWDVTQNYRGYWYDSSTKTFTVAGGSGTGGGEEGGETSTWLNWNGYWGDQQYPNSHRWQYCIFGECHYTSGPTGPVDKNLGRTEMCEHSGTCKIFNNINDITIQAK